MTVAAGHRMPPRRACSVSMTGHVATTTVVAQTTAPRNGRSVHSVPTMSADRIAARRIVRAKSPETALASSSSMIAMAR